MLTLGAHRSHLMGSVKEKKKDKENKRNYNNYSWEGGVISKLQVLEVIEKQPFKGHIKKQSRKWLFYGEHG